METDWVKILKHSLGYLPILEVNDLVYRFMSDGLVGLGSEELCENHSRILKTGLQIFNDYWFVRMWHIRQYFLTLKEKRYCLRWKDMRDQESYTYQDLVQFMMLLKFFGRQMGKIFRYNNDVHVLGAGSAIHKRCRQVEQKGEVYDEQERSFIEQCIEGYVLPNATSLIKLAKWSTSCQRKMTYRIASALKHPASEVEILHLDIVDSGKDLNDLREVLDASENIKLFEISVSNGNDMVTLISLLMDHVDSLNSSFALKFMSHISNEIELCSLTSHENGKKFCTKLRKIILCDDGEDNFLSEVFFEVMNKFIGNDSESDWNLIQEISVNEFSHESWSNFFRHCQNIEKLSLLNCNKWMLSDVETFSSQLQNHCKINEIVLRVQGDSDDDEDSYEHGGDSSSEESETPTAFQFFKAIGSIPSLKVLILTININASSLIDPHSIISTANIMRIKNHMLEYLSISLESEGDPNSNGILFVKTLADLLLNFTDIFQTIVYTISSLELFQTLVVELFEEQNNKTSHAFSIDAVSLQKESSKFVFQFSFHEIMTLNSQSSYQHNLQLNFEHSFPFNERKNQLIETILDEDHPINDVLSCICKVTNVNQQVLRDQLRIIDFEVDRLFLSADMLGDDGWLTVQKQEQNFSGFF